MSGASLFSSLFSRPWRYTEATGGVDGQRRLTATSSMAVLTEKEEIPSVPGASLFPLFSSSFSFLLPCSTLSAYSVIARMLFLVPESSTGIRNPSHHNSSEGS